MEHQCEHALTSPSGLVQGLPLSEHFLLQLFGVRLLKASRIPELTCGIFHRQQGIRDDLSALPRLAVPVTHIWNERVSHDILVEILVEPRTAARAEGPRHVPEVLDVDVVAHEDEPVDHEAALGVEGDVAHLARELPGGRLHLAQLLRVHLQDHPRDLRLERGPRVLDGQPLGLEEESYLSCGQWADHGMLTLC